MKKRYIIIIAIVVILAGIRIYLPFFARDQINKQLRQLEGYSGRVDRVSMQLFRGSVQLHDLVIYDENSSDPLSPFVKIGHNDVSIDWRALFRGKLVLEVHIDHLFVDFTMSEEEAIEEDPFDLAEKLEEIMPFNINIFTISNGEISVHDPTNDPPIHLYLSDFFLEATNFRNIEREGDTLPSTLSIHSQVMHTGRVELYAELNILRELPDFEFELEIEAVDLRGFNDFTEAYASFTISEGLLNLYTEAAALDGAITGYTKPIIENLEITPTDQDKGFLRELYEGILDTIGQILKNPDTENIGTRVEFEGRIDDPEVELWSAIWTLLRNAFFESISKGVEGVIDIDDLF